MRIGFCYFNSSRYRNSLRVDRNTNSKSRQPKEPEQHESGRLRAGLGFQNSTPMIRLSWLALLLVLLTEKVRKVRNSVEKSRLERGL